jgi:Protein of unknown function (DUF3800)
MIDVNKIRDADIRLHGLTKADDIYTIYYDETNNIRRLHVRPDGLNVKEPKCFVVGGVAHRGPVRELEFDTLRSALRLQKTVKDMKLEHVAKGDFLRVLSAPKLETFLRWLLAHDLFVHYSALDPLYWSIVDIIDSILTAHGEATLMMANRDLKNDLYTILRYDQNGTVDLFQRYSYPDVGREKRPAFVGELRDLLEHRRHLLPHFSFMMLKGVLQIAEKLDSLPYLEDETPNVLIDGFGLFFIQRICLLKNSEHILDIEEVVKAYLADQVFLDGERKLSNYRFVISHDEPGIQMSDVVTGLLGKFFSLIQSTEPPELVEMRQSLSAQQTTNIGLLGELLDRSLAENPAFIHFVLSLEDQERAAFFLQE